MSDEMKLKAIPWKSLTLKQKVFNIFYYYKWYMAAAVVLVFVLVVGFISLYDRNLQDAGVSIVGDFKLSTNAEKQMELDLIKYAGDFDGDGSINTNVRSQNLSESYRLNNPMQYDQELNILNTFIRVGDTFIYVVSKDQLRNYIGDDFSYFVPLADIKGLNYSPKKTEWHSKYTIPLDETLLSDIIKKAMAASGSSEDLLYEKTADGDKMKYFIIIRAQIMLKNTDKQTLLFNGSIDMLNKLLIQ